MSNRMQKNASIRFNTVSHAESAEIAPICIWAEDQGTVELMLH